MWTKSPGSLFGEGCVAGSSVSRRLTTEVDSGNLARMGVVWSAATSNQCTELHITCAWASSFRRGRAYTNGVRWYWPL